MQFAEIDLWQYLKRFVTESAWIRMRKEVRAVYVCARRGCLRELTESIASDNCNKCSPIRRNIFASRNYEEEKMANWSSGI